MFSIIIPLYNKEKFIGKTISSVLNQEFNDFELIIVNDGSTGNSMKIVNKFNDPRIKVIHQPNKGVSEARNQGISAAQNNYIAFLDGDDEWLPSFLSKILELINEYPEAGIYTTNYYINKYMLPTKELEDINSKSYEMLNPFKCFTDFNLSTSAIVIPKEIFNEVGLFIVDCHYGEDHEMWARIACRYKVIYSESILSIINIHDKNSLTKKNKSNAEEIYKRYSNDKIFKKQWFEANVKNLNERNVKEESVAMYLNKRRVDVVWNLLKNEDINNASIVLEELVYPISVESYDKRMSKIKILIKYKSILKFFSYYHKLNRIVKGAIKHLVSLKIRTSERY